MYERDGARPFELRHCDYLINGSLLAVIHSGARPFELRYCDYFGEGELAHRREHRMRIKSPDSLVTGEGELLTDATHAASATAATRVEVRLN